MTWVTAAIATAAATVGSAYLTSRSQKEASQLQASTAERESQRQKEMFDILNAQQAPYRGAGYSSLNQILAGLTGAQPQYDAQGNLIGTTPGTGFFTSMPGQAEIEAMPGYKFALGQGIGATRQALNPAGGGSNIDRASQKFAIDYTMGTALPQYMAQRKQIYDTLASIAGLGQTSQTETGRMGMQTAGNMAQLGIGAASALGAGQIGAAQAYGQGLQGLGNTAFMYNLMRSSGGGGGGGGGGGLTVPSGFTFGGGGTDYGFGGAKLGGTGGP